MSDSATKIGIALALVLTGAILLSGLGFLGILVQIARIDHGDPGGAEQEYGTENNQEMALAREEARVRFEISIDTASEARTHAPRETGIPIARAAPGITVPDVPASQDGVQTRSSGDDLMSGEGYLTKDSAPKTPEIDISGTSSLLGGKGSILEEAHASVKDQRSPSELPLVPVDEEAALPVSEEGVIIDDDRIDGVSEDLGEVSGELTDLLGDSAPETSQAGIGPDALSGTAWTVSNSTVRDSDKDGDPEWKYELRVAAGTVNRTLLNGTLTYIVGYEYEYRDADSDGEPEYERATSVRYANFSASGTTLAEGIEFSEALRNDTDGDGTVDRVEIRHLSYGYHATVLGTVKGFATAGELIMTDWDADGVFEHKEATAAFFFKHERTNPSVTLKEALVIVHGKETPLKAEVSKLAFQRINDTSGRTLLEEGYAWTCSETAGYKELVALAGRNNTVTGKVQYAVLNTSETVTDTGKRFHVTAFAIENSTLLLGGIRSDAVALDVTVVDDGSDRTEKGFLAAARTDIRPSRKDETFVLISVEREIVSNVTVLEEITVIAGHNATTTGLNSTLAMATRSYSDEDGDGNPEHLRTSWAVGRNEDRDLDGTHEAEAYIVHWEDMEDSDDDGVPERNQSFMMMGWKSDPDDDDNVDVERGLMTNITSYDANSNGYNELKETGTVGFERTDSDSDGTIDGERYLGSWEKVEDVNDDGTEINTRSGTWAHEA